MDSWNPQQYERFRSERARPLHDLADLVQPRPGLRVLDLGCGTGEGTRQLHDRWQAAETVGLDSSAAMLEKAAPLAGNGLRFAPGDIERLEEALGPSRWDVVFSNAALHWVPDHRALFPRLVSLLAEGGQLAVQMPANHGHPSHTTAYELADEPPFHSALNGWRREVPVLSPEAYASLLHDLALTEQRVRLEVYGHELSSRADVVEWVKGTLLTDYQSRLPPQLYEEFLARYRERLLPRLSDARPFFYTFPRVLLWGRRR